MECAETGAPRNKKALAQHRTKTTLAIPPMHTNICSPDNGGEPAQTHGIPIRSSGSLEVTFPEVIFPVLSRARLSPAPARFSGTELFLQVQTGTLFRIAFLYQYYYTLLSPVCQEIFQRNFSLLRLCSVYFHQPMHSFLKNILFGGVHVSQSCPLLPQARLL